MRKSATLPLVLVFLTASCVMAVNPVFSSAAVTEDSWATKAPMQQARAGLGVAVVNDKIYAIGGTTASGDSYPPDMFAGGFVGTNEMYDPATDTWTFRASMPTPRAYFAIAAYQNKIYCIGGAVGFHILDESTGLSGFYGYNMSGANEVYDIVTNTWETKKPLPYAETHLQASVVNGKIYVVGGAFTYVYDTETDSWAIKKQAPASHPWPIVVDNKLIVTGEYSPLHGSPEQKILIYDAKTDSWSGSTSGPTVVIGGAAGATTGVKAPQKVYVLGLTYGKFSPSTNQVYDPEANAWTTATAMPTRRQDFGVAVVNDIIYAIGGYYTESREAWLHGLVTPVAVNEQYIPMGYGTPPEIKVVSPESKTYNASSVPLIVTVNKPVNWTGYSLNGKNNVTISGNTTLSELPNGAYNITVYATEQFGNTGGSEIVYFNIDAPEPFPTISVAAAVVSVAVVCVGLLVYFRKRKH